MTTLKLIILALFAGNIFLIGLEASKQPGPVRAAPIEVQSKVADAPTISLLSELETESGVQSAFQCYSVGPFESRDTVDAIAEMLQTHASSVSARETEAFVDRGFWVYLPPFDDEVSAVRAMNSLYDAGLDDLSVLKDGEWNHSVSLGYFVNQPNAIKHKQIVQEMGYPAEIRIQRDDESRFWVDYQQQTGVEYASRILAGLVPAELHRSTVCANDEAPVKPAGSS
jgi:hypothetical protein